jgi:hypothetical protein
MNARLATAGLLVAFLLPPAPAFAGEAEDRTELARLEQAWLDAGSRNDKAAIGRILAPTFVNTTVDGVRRDRSQVLEAAPLPEGASQRLRDMSITITGNTAVITGINVFTPRPGAMPVEVAYTDVYVRDEQGWKAVASHETLKARRAP